MINTSIIIDEALVASAISAAKEPDAVRFAHLLKKAGAGAGLDEFEAAELLSIKDATRLNELYNAATELKLRLFGKRVVLFAPLYLSNYCTNGCVYCGFRSTNRGALRKALTVKEAVHEASLLEGMGFKRALLVTGEDPRYGLGYIVDCVKAIYKETGMRIVHVNAPPMDIDGFVELRSAGVGVYQSFQETYSRDRYAVLHPSGKKKDYDFRLSVMDSAMDGGFKDVGIGPLFGLYDYKYECVSTIAHSRHLFEKYGAHAHTISIPRLRPADGFSVEKDFAVTDEDMLKAVAVMRLSVPSAGIVISTRESAAFRSELLKCGATQMSAASRTNPGGYAETDAIDGASSPQTELHSIEQFSTQDTRSLSEVMKAIAREGWLPSLCTTCYRVGREGADFTKKTTAGEMEKFCQANAVLTLKEYLVEHDSNGTQEALKRALLAGIEEINDLHMKKAVLEKLEEIEDGKRDVYF